MSQVKALDVLALLKKHGVYELKDRQVGAHHRYIDSKGHKVNVKYSIKQASIPPKTYNSILKQAGLK